MNEEIFKGYVRKVTEEDINTLPTCSYSKLEVKKNCDFQYNKKYNEKKYSSDTSLALELGSLCHYVLEQKGILIKNKLDVGYERLNNILKEGTSEIDEKTRENLLGVNALKKKYFETWWEADNASGMTYEQKMDIFNLVLHKEMEEPETVWQPTYFERKFEFVWDNRVIITGFIDRIDTYVDEEGITHYRTIDYKTSKKIYEQSKLATSLQFGIYALAILNEFGVLPNENQYRFILLNDTQYALTKGWEKRLIKALTKILDQIDEGNKTGIWKPSPTPLCHWCSYCKTNPNAAEYKSECPYYSLWTPENKTFQVNMEWDESKTNSENNRKLIF